MRRPTVFISIPNSKQSEDLYYNCLKKIQTQNRIEGICFFDEPLVQNFEKTICTHIAFSNLVIGVLENGNQNVSYELGVAKGYGKPIILLADNNTKPQSLLSQYDIIYYDKDNLNYEKLLSRLHDSIDRIFYSNHNSLRSKVHGQLLVKIEESNTIIPHFGGDDDLLKIAIREYNNKNFQVAIDVLTSRPPSEIFDTDYYFFLCDSYFLESEKMEEGGRKNLYLQKMLETAISGLQLYPNNQVLLKCRGLAHLKMKQLEPAKQIFEKLLKDYPNYDVGRYNLACVFAQLGDLFNTIINLSIIFENEESWRSLARLDPDFDPLWHKDAFQRLLYPIHSRI